MSDWRASLDRTSRTLLLREPYYGHLVVGVNKAAEDLSCLVRLAPSARQVFFEVNPERWNAATDEQRLAALRHELVHLTLRHPLRAKGREQLDVWGMACDLVVNQLIDTTHLPDALCVEHFPWLSREQSADAYYQQLLPLFGEERRCGGMPTAEWCVSHGFCQGSHGRWSDFAGLPSGVLSVLDTNVERLLIATARRTRKRGWGHLPAALVAALSALGQPPELPWRRLLRLFIAQSGRTFVRNTISRRSKRYGTVPGTKVKRRHKLTVAVDTSGSISDDELATFFGEIHAIWRRGTTVHVVEADAAVARDYSYRGGIPKTVKGRGGTSFDPVIRWSNAHRADGLVYFTDGEAPAPTVPSRCPLLWVVTSDGRVEGLPGRTVRLR